jgi:hypothetical protein
LSICLSANSKYSGLSNKDSKKGLSSTNFSYVATGSFLKIKSPKLRRSCVEPL